MTCQDVPFFHQSFQKDEKNFKKTGLDVLIEKKNADRGIDADLSSATSGHRPPFGVLTHLCSSP